MAIFEQLQKDYDLKSIYCNRDYEPPAKRDIEIKEFLNSKNIERLDFKEQVIFEKNEVDKDNEEPYMVYTPLFNKRKKLLSEKFILRLKLIKLNF